MTIRHSAARRAAPGSSPTSRSPLLTRLTKINTSYIVTETLDGESSIPREFRLSRNGIVVLTVQWPDHLKVIDFASDAAHKAEPKLFYTTQAAGSDAQGLNVVLLSENAKPRFLLKNFPCRDPSEHADRTLSVEDLGIGVNLQPGDTTIDDRYPMVQLERHGDTYLPSPGSMRFDPAHASVDDFVQEIIEPLKLSYEQNAGEKSAPPLTGLVLSRVYELIYYGESVQARKLLELVYPNTKSLVLKMPFGRYFGAAGDLKQMPAKTVSKDVVWGYIVDFLRQHSKYLPTLKQLNPELFRGNNGRGEGTAY